MISSADELCINYFTRHVSIRGFLLCFDKRAHDSPGESENARNSTNTDKPVSCGGRLIAQAPEGSLPGNWIPDLPSLPSASPTVKSCSMRVTSSNSEFVGFLVSICIYVKCSEC